MIEFDLERAKRAGATTDQLKIMNMVNENMRKRNSCAYHNFERIEGTGGKYVCKNCGCREDSSFVTGYRQGLQHAANLEASRNNSAQIDL